MNRLAVVLLGLLLSACAMGPDYKRPTVPTPQQYGEANGYWQPAQPQDGIPHGDWWRIYHDPVLAALEQQVASNNQTVKQSAAQYREANALLNVALAGLLPTLTGNVSSTTSQTNKTMFTVPDSTLDRASVNASWTLDIWGQLRREAEAAQATADADKATWAAAILSAQATLAESYLQLRALDADVHMLAQTEAMDQNILDITANLYHSGVDTPADVALAQATLESVQAQKIDLGVQRAQLTHAIALLTGRPPSGFSIAAVDSLPELPKIPASVPSVLLQHRPDISAAERQVAAANAQIGVAQAAFFPALSLNGQIGYQGGNFPNLLIAPNQFWSVGPSLAQTLFDGGILSAQKAQAVAAYDASVANYRQVVLTGFQEVEDDLASLRILAQEDGVQRQAMESARTALKIATDQYQYGMVSYTNVLQAQTTALANEKAWLDVEGRELVSSAGLVTALGGLWE